VTADCAGGDDRAMLETTEGRVPATWHRRIGMELHRRKVARYIADMQARGFRRREAAPWLYRRLWDLGLPVSPPLFLGFIPVALLMSTVIALGATAGVALLEVLNLWLTGSGIYSVRVLGVAVPSFVVTGLVAGMSGGLTVAAYCRWKAWQLGLGDWESYPTA
jgi:hypothetical protein